jgi:DNA-directed RNA polymerase specialized sigma subunit
MNTPNLPAAIAAAGDHRDASAGISSGSDCGGDDWVAQARDALCQAIARLDRQEQRVIVGHYYEEQSVAELAEIYDLSADQICDLIQEALQKLRRIVLH